MSKYNNARYRVVYLPAPASHQHRFLRPPQFRRFPTGHYVEAAFRPRWRASEPMHGPWLSPWTAPSESVITLKQRDRFRPETFPLVLDARARHEAQKPLRGTRSCPPSDDKFSVTPAVIFQSLRACFLESNLGCSALWHFVLLRRVFPFLRARKVS